jgi:hypothetical protein
VLLYVRPAQPIACGKILPMDTFEIRKCRISSQFHLLAGKLYQKSYIAPLFGKYLFLASDLLLMNLK